MKKNSCTPINPKTYSCYDLKTIHTRNLITKKIPASRKFSSAPHNFSKGPSLIIHVIKTGQKSRFYSPILVEWSVYLHFVCVIWHDCIFGDNSRPTSRGQDFSRVAYCSWMKRLFENWICSRTYRHLLQIWKQTA